MSLPSKLVGEDRTWCTMLRSVFASGATFLLVCARHKGHCLDLEISDLDLRSFFLGSVNSAVENTKMS